MKKLTIYDVSVKMKDQAQCDRMKQVCIDNGLKHWESDTAFELLKNNINPIFFYVDDLEFYVYDLEDYKLENEFNKTQVTEEQFLELLKNRNDGRK